MPGYAARFRLLPIVLPILAALCVGSCLSTEGFYRYQDAGTPGAAGTMGIAGVQGTAGTTGSGGSAAGTTGTPGTAGSATGTAGTLGRGGTTGSAGTVGSGGSGPALFMDDFETGMDGWNGQGPGTHSVVMDGSQVLTLSDLAVAASDRKQHVVAAGNLAWRDVVVEARVKPLSYAGTDTAYIAGIVARLTDIDHFYYFGIQGDGRGKIKINDSGNSSLSSSINFNFVANTWYTLKLSVVGGTLTGYINGTMVGQVTDTTFAAGAIGVMVQDASAVFDDVVVRSAP